LGIDQKMDDSPVTAADLAAHKVILAGLQALTPDIPVLSEEAVV
jgi:3'(2'), 5'-bisphosphate nucleotidase